jgi:FlaG/FlaF family flagellin (archaellin)
VFLAVQVWDGDSWATVWRSATGAPAGTAVSIDIAGLTDGSGNAVRIVTNAATARQFDYVFVYHIDLG